jgi:hypothetical protein
VYRTSIGQPVGYFYGYKTCGVYQSDADAQRIPDGTIGGNKPGAGDMCFQDLHGPTKTDSLTHLPILTAPDDSISTEDKVYLGKTIPDAYYGINLNAAYRNLDFTAFFNGVMGVQRYNSLRQSMESMAGGNGNQLATTQNRWTTSHPSNTMPRAISGDPAGNNRFSDRWVEDGDFFRLKTVQLGYTLPENILGSHSSGTRIYVSATNLWTLTDYSGLDPEFTTRGNSFNQSNNGSQIAAGTDDGNVPQPRMFQIGISTSF